VISRTNKKCNRFEDSTTIA